MKFDNIVVLGDLHYNLNPVIELQIDLNLTNTLFLQCGDFGIGGLTIKKDVARLEYFNSLLAANNNFLYSVRGNHDNPKRFTGKYDTSNIKLVPDYHILEIEYDGINRRILFIGGAISVDRSNRKGFATNKASKDYWPDEFIVVDELKLNSIKDIDIVITHSAPNFCYPFVKVGMKQYTSADTTLIDDCCNERFKLTSMYNILKENSRIKYWFYGHFHDAHDDYINETKFILLHKQPYPKHFYIIDRI